MYKDFNKNYIDFTSKVFNNEYVKKIEKIFRKHFTSEKDRDYFSDGSDIYSLFALLGMSFVVKNFSIEDFRKNDSIVMNASIETENVELYPEIFKELMVLEVVKSFNICLKSNDDYIVSKLTKCEDSMDLFWAEIPLQYGMICAGKGENPIYKIKENYFVCKTKYNNLRDILVNSQDISPVDIYQELESPWSNTAIGYRIIMNIQHNVFECEFTSIVYDGIYQSLIAYGKTPAEALSNLEKEMENLKQECYKKDYISSRDALI